MAMTYEQLRNSAVLAHQVATTSGSAVHRAKAAFLHRAAGQAAAREGLTQASQMHEFIARNTSGGAAEALRASRDDIETKDIGDRAKRVKARSAELQKQEQRTLSRGKKGGSYYVNSAGRKVYTKGG